MVIGCEEKMEAIAEIQSKLHPQNTLNRDFVYGCDCTGCSGVCYERCGDGQGPMS